MILEELFEADLKTASKAASDLVPDVVAALNRLMPRLTRGGDRMVVRRYFMSVDAAAQALTAVPARHREALPPPTVLYQLLRRDIAELPWVAPSADGDGILTVLVDRLRGFAAGLPNECVKARPDIDIQRFHWFFKSVAEIEDEQRYSDPLRRAMVTMDLSSRDMADLMGVTRQAVDRWLLTGPPTDRLDKIGAIAEIADVLRYRLRDGMAPVVARRRAGAYNGRSMLELIAQDEHEWLRQAVKDSFDLTRVA